MVCLEGDALAWYYYEESRRTFQGWPEFKKLLLERFHSSQIGNMMEQLLALRQTLSVGEYCRSFELLSALFLDLLEAVLENSFVNGLQDEIKTELRLWEPKGLSRVMKMAQMTEDKNQASSRYQKGISLQAGRFRCSPATSNTTLSPKTPLFFSSLFFDGKDWHLPWLCFTIFFSHHYFTNTPNVLLFLKLYHTHQVPKINRCGN